jgi:hypothetical protein
LTKYLIAAAVVVVAGLGFSYGTDISSRVNSGIHVISPNAVYLAGEACTVNMHLERSEEEISNEMLECLSLHRSYMENTNE